MTHIYIYYAALLAICAYAFWEGGSPERWAASLMLAASVVTSINGFLRLPGFGGIDPLRLAIDLALLFGLVGIALYANRYWPLWVAALHLIAVAVHGVRAYDPSLVPWIYAAAVGKIAYPIIALLAIGAYRHRRRRQHLAHDADWSAWDTAS